MKTFGYLILLASLTSCAAKLPKSAARPDGDDQVAIDSAILAWREAGFSWTKECTDQYNRIHIVRSQPLEFLDLCGERPVQAGGNWFACSTEQIQDNRIPLLVISALQPTAHQRLLVIHEMMHWLEQCSGKGIDHRHADKRVWQGALEEAEKIFLTSTIQFGVNQSVPTETLLRGTSFSSIEAREQQTFDP